MLVAENEDDLQRLLHQFNLVAKSFNMVISSSKFLGIDLLGYGDVEAAVREQTTRATKIAGCLNATIWRNKNIGID